jgi:hypothetical protein
MRVPGVDVYVTNCVPNIADSALLPLRNCHQHGDEWDLTMQQCLTFSKEIVAVVCSLRGAELPKEHDG